MKKTLIALAAVVVIGGYVLYQNQGRFFLILLAQHRLSNPFQSSGNTAPATNISYKNGTYTGSVEDAFYGNVQVQATITGGKITDVQFLQYPHDALRSQAINSLAMPNLRQEAITAQIAQVDVVSGATDTSNAFVQSLQTALSQAK